MKLIILTQAKIENESDPKVSPLGKSAINPEDISMIHDVIDKYDEVIKGVTGLKLKNDGGFYVVGDFNTIMELLEQDTFA